MRETRRYRKDVHKHANHFQEVTLRSTKDFPRSQSRAQSSQHKLSALTHTAQCLGCHCVRLRQPAERQVGANVHHSLASH